MMGKVKNMNHNEVRRDFFNSFESMGYNRVLNGLKV